MAPAPCLQLCCDSTDESLSGRYCWHVSTIRTHTTYRGPAALLSSLSLPCCGLLLEPTVSNTSQYSMRTHAPERSGQSPSISLSCSRQQGWAVSVDQGGSGGQRAHHAISSYSPISSRACGPCNQPRQCYREVNEGYGTQMRTRLTLTQSRTLYLSAAPPVEPFPSSCPPAHVVFAFRGCSVLSFPVHPRSTSSNVSVTAES